MKTDKVIYLVKQFEIHTTMGGKNMLQMYSKLDAGGKVYLPTWCETSINTESIVIVCRYSCGIMRVVIAGNIGAIMRLVGAAIMEVIKFDRIIGRRW
jgi:hypothetical protein